MPEPTPKQKSRETAARGSTTAISNQPESKRRVPGRPFEPGDPRAGRPLGCQNKATAEVKSLARALVDDPLYREALRERLVSGDCAPAVEVLLWHYAYGKPKETVAVEIQRGPALLPEERPLQDWQEAFGVVREEEAN